MKKLIAIAALIGTASLSFGQGYVSFFNGSASRVSTNTAPSATGGSAPATLAGGPVGSFYYALLVAPTTTTTIDSSLAGWAFSGVIGTNTATSGRVLGFTSTDGVGARINGFAIGSTADFAIVGWSSNIGTDWASALAWWNNGQTKAGSTVSYFGISGVATGIALAAEGSAYNNVWGLTSSGQIQGMTLGAYQVVPEPASMALMGLGAAALMIFRRRK
jgi:hypothetical protein